MASTLAHILTARLDERSFAFFDELRRRHFPRERNHLCAHITLFHALPLEALEAVAAAVTRDSDNRAAIPVEFGPAYSLGRGVAFPVLGEAIARQRESWREEWSLVLGKQDQAKKRLHITVQNKVVATVARQTLSELSREILPRPAWILGFDLHRYEGGPWTWLRGWDFRDIREMTSP